MLWQYMCDGGSGIKVRPAFGLQPRGDEILESTAWLGDLDVEFITEILCSYLVISFPIQLIISLS